MTEPIRVATRRSPLALAQARLVADRISSLTGIPTELVEVVSEGDVNTGPLATIGGTGVFVTAVRAALRSGRADIAVHSLKDLPTEPAPDFVMAAVPARADARDALCSAVGPLAELPAAATVGTGSPRRRAQLLAVRPDLNVVPIRGNVGTRLAMVGHSVDAVVLAAAGLARLNLTHEATELLPVTTLLPAAGQGALAIETHTSAKPSLLLSLQQLDDPATRAATEAERSLLAALEAGCSAPVGAYAENHLPGSTRPHLHLRGGVYADTRAVHMSVTGLASEAKELGSELAGQLLAAGAAGLLSESKL
jgi:hydroxymethylbilane synthase